MGRKRTQTWQGGRGEGGNSLIWAIRGRPTGQGMGERKELRYQVIYHFISRGGGKGVGGNSLIWAIRGRPTGQGMVSWPRCPKLGVQFDFNLS